MFNFKGVANYLLSAILSYDDKSSSITCNSNIDSIRLSVTSNSVTIRYLNNSILPLQIQLIRTNALKRFHAPIINVIANNINYTEIEKEEIFNRVNQQINLEDLTNTGNDNENKTHENDSTNSDSTAENPILESMNIDTPEQTTSNSDIDEPSTIVDEATQQLDTNNNTPKINPNGQNNIDYICGIPAEQWWTEKLGSAFDARVQSLTWEILQKVTTSHYQMQNFFYNFQQNMQANIPHTPHHMPALNQPMQHNFFPQPQQPVNYLQPQPNYFPPRHDYQPQQQPYFNNANAYVENPMQQQPYPLYRNQKLSQQQLDGNANANYFNQPQRNGFVGQRGPHQEVVNTTQTPISPVALQEPVRSERRNNKAEVTHNNERNQLVGPPTIAQREEELPQQGNPTESQNLEAIANGLKRFINIVPVSEREARFVKILRSRLSQHTDKCYYHEDYTTRIEIGTKCLGSGVNGTVNNGVFKIGPERKGVAIKKTQLVYGDNEEGAMYEALITITSNHPNIVRAEAIFFKSNELVLALELMNTSLKGLLNKMLIVNAEFSEGHVVYIARRVLNALCYLEQNWGLLHGDLKNDNILIDNYGQVKLTDFGFARPYDSSISYPCGTPGFMAPEVADRNRISDVKADIWAFGITLIELIDFDVPFYYPDNCEHSRILQHASSVSTPPRFRRKNFPSTLQDILTKQILCIDPNERLTARELIKVFDDGVNSGSLQCCNRVDMASFISAVDIKMTRRHKA